MAVEEKKILLDRKKFLKGAGASLAGLALMGGVGSLLAGCDQGGAAAPTGSESAPSWPVAYEKLDPDKAEQLAYDSYQAGHG